MQTRQALNNVNMAGLWLFLDIEMEVRTVCRPIIEYARMKMLSAVEGLITLDLILN